MMTGNRNYEGIDDLPTSIPIFPLSGALLLPHGQMPLNIFEPRYLAMIDAAIAGDRVIGMVQPSFDDNQKEDCGLCKVGCAGRIVSLSETGDNRYLISLIGISRFTIQRELEVTTPYRQILADWRPYQNDLQTDKSGDDVDRDGLLKTFRSYLDVNNLEADWESIEETQTHILVNALSMMTPYGAAEKQALLEANNLKIRAETLIAITEMSLAQQDTNGNTILQ
ncbi:MAG: LON peptidase substrate-binding domain-containing protein [Hyphomicrobiales bacterium]